MRGGLPAVLLCGLLLSSLAVAQPQEELLLQGMPNGFKVASQDREGPIVTTNLVPESEGRDDWTEMLTSQLYLGLKHVTLEAFRTESKRKWLEGCKEGQFAEMVSGDENGYPIMLWMLTCPYSKAPGRPEISIFKGIRGTDNLYVLQKTFRFEPNKEQIALWMRYLKTVIACDPRTSTHACPAADSVGGTK